MKLHSSLTCTSGIDPPSIQPVEVSPIFIHMPQRLITGVIRTTHPEGNQRVMLSFLAETLMHVIVWLIEGATKASIVDESAPQTRLLVHGRFWTVLQSAPFHPAGQSQSPVSKLQFPTPLQSPRHSLLPLGAGFHAIICRGAHALTKFSASPASRLQGYAQASPLVDENHNTKIPLCRCIVWQDVYLERV